ncbi:MAG: urease accessory protein UreE [Burkholderiaceae bacterium]
MIYYTKVLKGGKGLAKTLLERAPSVSLDWDLRQKSRFETTDSNACPVGVVIARGQVLRGQDVLVGEDGSFLKVLAKDQLVLRITFCAEHGSPFDLTRAAYHLGNRHVPIELKQAYLQIEPDHVLASMLENMHLIVQEIAAPFEPETGAYSEESKDAHAHSHAHLHDHKHHGHQAHG